MVINAVLTNIHASCSNIHTIDHTYTTNFIVAANLIDVLSSYIDIAICTYGYSSFSCTWPGTDGSYLYTADLLGLEHSSADRPTNVDPHLLTVHTPLILSSWKQHLLLHSDQDFAKYILNGIETGFSICRNTMHPLQSASKNVPSARENLPVIKEYLHNEIQLGSNWTSCRVIARCDNESIVTVLNSHYSKKPHVMSMLETLFL